MFLMTSQALMDCAVCYKTANDLMIMDPKPYVHCIQKPRLTEVLLLISCLVIAYCKRLELFLRSCTSETQTSIKTHYTAFYPSRNTYGGWTNILMCACVWGVMNTNGTWADIWMCFLSCFRKWGQPGQSTAKKWVTTVELRHCWLYLLAKDKISA